MAMDGGGPDLSVQAQVAREIPVVWEEQAQAVGVDMHT
jgi:hypothetical protein